MASSSPCAAARRVQADCFIKVFGNALAVFVAIAKIKLRRSIPLIGGKAVQTNRFFVILRHALTVLIAIAEIILRFR